MIIIKLKEANDYFWLIKILNIKENYKVYILVSKIVKNTMQQIFWSNNYTFVIKKHRNKGYYNVVGNQL